MGTKFTVSDNGVVTVTNDLAVDTNVIYVNTSTNRVGVNLTSPSYPLDVVGDVNISVGSLYRIDGNQITSAALADSNSLQTTTLADSKIWVGSAVNVATEQTISGDIAINTAGVVAIASNVIVDADINTGAAISGSKINPNFVAQNVVTTGNITGGTGGFGTSSQDATAVLQADSTSKGFLAPRMTAAQRGAIVTPATGLLVYQTDGTAGYYYYNGATWSQVGSGGHTIQDEGTPATARANLNFVGDAVAVTDDAGNNATVVTVSGNGSTPVREDFVATASQTTFTLANTLTAGKEHVYRNGQLKRLGASYDYTISGQDIIFNTGLDTDDKVTVFIVTSLLTGNMPVVQSYVATASQTVFAVTQTFSIGQERVFANGVRKLYGLSNDYTVSGNSIVFNTGRSLGDVVVVEVLAALPTATSAMPQWQSYTVPYTSFTGFVALTGDIEVMSLPAGAVIHGVIISHTASFTGGGRTACTMSVGITGTLAKYATAFNVFQAPGPSVGQISNIVGLEDKVSATSIRLAASSDINLSLLAAGSVTVKILVSQAF